MGYDPSSFCHVMAGMQSTLPTTTTQQQQLVVYSTYPTQSIHTHAMVTNWPQYTSSSINKLLYATDRA